jgi:hypothetical protein
MKTKSTITQKYGKGLRRLVTSVLFGAVLFVLVKPSFVGVVAKESDLSLFLAGSDVEAGIKVSKNGFSQIKYKYNGKEVDVTDNSYTNSDPVTDGEYIVWMSQIDSFWQIMMYYIPGAQILQLSSGENNVNPEISGKHVVWEGQVNGIWQIFLFDGIKSTQITDTEGPSQDADIEGNYFVYGEKDLEFGLWKIYLYDISTQETKSLTHESNGRFPRISDGVVEWASVVNGASVFYFYEIATDTISTSKPVASTETVISEFDDTAFEEFVGTLDEEVIEATETAETTETTQSEQQIDSETDPELLVGDSQPGEVTVEDIENELGI